MERYLLFDSGCSRCSHIAKAVEAEARGWFTVRSLREQSVQAQLAATDPNWAFQPTLMEVEGDQARIFTGLHMRLKLLAGLGLRRAMRVASIVMHPPGPASGVDQTRRDLVRNGGILIGGLALLGVGSALKPERAMAGKTAARRGQAAGLSAQPLGTDQQIPAMPLTLAEAAMARQMFLQSPDLQTFLQFNQRQGRSLAAHTQTLAEIPANASAPNAFHADGQVMYLAGEHDGVRLVEVAFGVVGHAGYVSGLVNPISGQVGLVTQTDIFGGADARTIRTLTPAGQVAIHHIEQGVATQLFNNLGETVCPERVFCEVAVKMSCMLDAQFLCMLLPSSQWDQCVIDAFRKCTKLAERVCGDRCLHANSCDDIPGSPGGPALPPDEPPPDGNCEDCEAVTCNMCCLMCVTVGGWWCASSGLKCNCSQ